MWPPGAAVRAPEPFAEVEEGSGKGLAGLVGTHLADMLCEAVPRARRPSTHRPKHSVTSGEFQSWSTGCSTRTPSPEASSDLGQGTWGGGWGPGEGRRRPGVEAGRAAPG